MQAPLSWAQVAALALEAGFPPAAAVIAAAITEPESGRIQDNVQAGQPYATTGWGLWQITPGNSEPQFGTDQQMLIGLNNARAAHAKWQAAGGFSPWTTFENGLEQPYIGDAEKAVAAVRGLSLRELQRLVNSTAAQGGADGARADAAARHIEFITRQVFRRLDRDLIAHRIAADRIGLPGWIP
jgi:hypothetical protein